ncbi:MAG: PadR family transcriptional regulator, partial [Acidimicrobiales bacterium]
WMSEELARHGYKISPGTLYPALHQMEADGLLRSRSEVVDGRARRSYTATAKGRRALAAAKDQLRELANELLGDEAAASPSVRSKTGGRSPTAPAAPRRQAPKKATAKR